MAKVIDIEGVKSADALVADALRCNPHVLDRLTIEDIEMAFNAETPEEKTVLVTIRVPRPLLEQFDESVREQAYKKKTRITRNSAMIELIAGAVAGNDKELEDQDASDRAALALADTDDFEDWQTVKARNGL